MSDHGEAPGGPASPGAPAGDKTMVDYIGIERIRQLVVRRGAARFIEELTFEIEADFLRWSEFDKSARHATHSPAGVIELMPASDKLERKLARLALSDLEVLRCASSAAAVQGADIITTVTADKRNATILTPEMITGGVHVNAVGGDCPGKTELHPDILSRADVRVVVEYGPQTRIEGEIQQMPADFPVIELAQVLAGRAPGRAGKREVTIFDSVGLALEELSALRYLLHIHHEERGREQQIDLLPDLEDSKDLFGVLAGEPEPLAAERGVAA